MAVGRDVERPAPGVTVRAVGWLPGSLHAGPAMYLRGHCCVDGKRAVRATLAPRSDGEGEFGEDCGEPLAWVNIQAEFVVAATEVLHERVPGADNGG